MAEDPDIGALFRDAFDKALMTQYPTAVKNVARLRRVNPDKSPAELLSYLDKFYLGIVATSGAVAGAAAVVPKRLVGIAARFADLVVFSEASVLYTLSVAEIHGLDVEDFERRRLLVMCAFVGNRGTKSVLGPLVDRSAPYWGRQIVKKIPMAAINKANKVLGPRFVTKYGTKMGVLVLGEQIPFFIGAGVGAGGSTTFGWFIVRAVRKLLGPPPESWDELNELVL